MASNQSPPPQQQQDAAVAPRQHHMHSISPSPSPSNNTHSHLADDTAPPETDIAGHQRATINGGLRGAALATVLVGGVHLALRKKPTYANFSWGPKSFGYVCIAVPCISISAEKAGEAFERSRWYGLGKRELDRQALLKEQKWEAMTGQQRLNAWAKANKWSLIAGAWAGSLGIAFAIVARTPQTFSQKLVQARMWAQGLTVGTLLGSALIAGAASTGNKVVEGKQDHSWANLLEQEGELNEEELKKIRAGKQSQHQA